jgi:hypothetical protein
MEQETFSRVRAVVAEPRLWNKICDKRLPDSVDLFQAVSSTVSDAALRDVLYARLARAARRLFPERMSDSTFDTKYDHVLDVHDINNHPATIHADILRLLDAAAV